MSDSVIQVVSGLVFAAGVYGIIAVVFMIVLYKINGGATFAFEAFSILFFSVIWPITIPIAIYIFIQDIRKKQAPNE